MKFILRILFFLVGIILVACTSDEKQPVSRTIVTEMQPLTLLPNADVKPGDTLTFYATLLENEFTKNNGKQKPELYTKITTYKHDRDPGNVTFVRLSQKLKGENKFYGTFIVPPATRNIYLLNLNKEFQPIAVEENIFPIRDSIAAYMRSLILVHRALTTEDFPTLFKNIRSEHPLNLEVFRLWWERNKSSKQEMQRDIDSLARIFPGHKQLIELRLLTNMVYFDSSSAMKKEITAQLDTLLQRDSLAMFASPMYNHYTFFLVHRFNTGEKTPEIPFEKYLIAFAKKVSNPKAFPSFIYDLRYRQIYPTTFFRLFNTFTTANTDPLLRLIKAIYTIKYIKNDLLPKDSLLGAEQALKSVITDVYRPDFVESGISFEPLYLWRIRYWPYQNLTYALKMQGRLDEARDSLLSARRQYSQLHDRQGEILYELGNIALEQSDTSAFFQYMVRANRIKPTFPFPLQELKAQAEKRGVTDFEEFYRSLSDAIPFETMPLPEGTPATLAGTDATTIQLTGKRKKPLLLFFTTSTCSPCKILYKAMLEEMKNNPGKYDVDICLVFPNNDKGFAGYVQANGGKAKNVFFAESSTLHGVFGVSGVPDVAVINREGVITGFVRGAGPNDNVQSLLSAAK